MNYSPISDYYTINKEVYIPCGLKVLNYQPDKESKEYEAASLLLNNIFIKTRKSKITPKKTGQFVTLWRRNVNGLTVPLNVSDNFTLVVITCSEQLHLGQFIFTKEILMEKGIITQVENLGKRGFVFILLGLGLRAN